MKRRTLRSVIYLLLALQVSLGVIPPLSNGLEAQRRGNQEGRSANKSSNVNRSGSARSGSTSRSSGGSRSAGRNTSNRSASQRGGRSANTRRKSSRRTTSRRGGRTRSRRVHRSQRFRRGVWRSHRFWRHQRWYGGFWVGRVLIRTAAFVVIANSSTTVVVHSTTYYYYNPWYRKTLYDGEETYVLTSAPVGYETDELPEGAETVQVDGATYHYADWSFYQQQAGGGYIVVEPPVGAEVSAIPEEAVEHDEGEVPLYQFDKLYFSRDTNDAGQQVYRVEPAPPEEEIDEIPDDAVTFVADGETYYYVNYNLYVEYDEDGKTGFVNGEPEVGAQLDELPEGAVTITEDGFTYYQFDMVFFEEVEGEDGSTFFEVVDSPDGADAVELEA